MYIVKQISCNNPMKNKKNIENQIFKRLFIDKYSDEGQVNILVELRVTTIKI